VPCKITAVISFCSNDWRFLKQCISGVAPFCDQVIITVCDHFFDGSAENYALLEEAFRRFPDCTFLSFPFDPLHSYRTFSPLYPEHHNWRHEWHNTGRWLSYFYSSEQTEFLFFLDCDEIVDSARFTDWLNETDLHGHSAYRFAMFWHFREAKYEALVTDDLSMLVQKAAIHPDFLWDQDERLGLFQCLPNPKRRDVRGCDKVPMIRHYTGVRTQDEQFKKFSTWGHHWERDWESLILEEYSRPFNGKDFIRRYHYREVEPVFDPLMESLPLLAHVSYEEHLNNLQRFPNVIRMSKTEAFKRQLEYDFSIESRLDHYSST
jgi:hypothetical protein